MSKITKQYRTTEQLLAKAARDSDPVSVFVNGSNWDDADCAIFVVMVARKRSASMTSWCVMD